MNRFRHRLGTLLIAAGIGMLGWAGLVWAWEDPFTSLYTLWEQRKLEQRFDRLVADYRPPARGTSLAAMRSELRAEARAFRRRARRGQPLGRITAPRMGLRMLVVNGTDDESLKKGPGRDERTFMPGEGELVYIAGHRTTYSAPFSKIDALRRGDRVTLELPYGTFQYRISGHRIVAADNLSVLQSRGRDVLALQACHPRFFASQRYIAYGRLVAVQLRGMDTRAVSPAALAAAART